MVRIEKLGICMKLNLKLRFKGFLSTSLLKQGQTLFV